MPSTGRRGGVVEPVAVRLQLGGAVDVVDPAAREHVHVGGEDGAWPCAAARTPRRPVGVGVADDAATVAAGRAGTTGGLSGGAGSVHARANLAAAPPPGAVGADVDDGGHDDAAEHDGDQPPVVVERRRAPGSGSARRRWSTRARLLVHVDDPEVVERGTTPDSSTNAAASVWTCCIAERSTRSTAWLATASDTVSAVTSRPMPSANAAAVDDAGADAVALAGGEQRRDEQHQRAAQRHRRRRRCRRRTSSARSCRARRRRASGWRSGSLKPNSMAMPSDDEDDADDPGDVLGVRQIHDVNHVLIAADDDEHGHEPGRHGAADEQRPAHGRPLGVVAGRPPGRGST